MWGEIYDRVAEQIRAHRTTLIFVGTRRMSERVAFALNERLGEGFVMPHHGSLARELRFDVEQRLRRRRAARGRCDRFARARHRHRFGRSRRAARLAAFDRALRCSASGAPATGSARCRKGTFYVTTRDELIECAALVRAIRRGALDALADPATRRSTSSRNRSSRRARSTNGTPTTLYATGAGHVSPIATFAASDFDAVVSMLADGVATSRGRSGTFLHYDRVNGKLRARRGARLAAITCGGAIPDTANFNVIVEPEGHVVGTLDEDFAVESMAGDIFLLGTNSWKIRRVEAGVVRVEDAHGAPPSIPFWNGEGLGRTIELSREVSRGARARSTNATTQSAMRGCSKSARLDAAGAEQAVAYVRAGKADPRRRADRHDDRRRALLRRRRRDAADPARAVRRAHQPRVGTGAAQDVSAARSTSSCRPPQPTTASCSRSPISTPFRSTPSSSS